MKVLIQTLLCCLMLCAAQAGISSSPCTAEIITTDQEICDNFFMVSAVAPEVGETGAWTGPAGTSFLDINDPMTFITNLSAGSNVITWTIFDGSGTACSVDEITIINSKVQTTPVITTANNTEVCDENGFQVAAQGPLLSGETGFWNSDNGNVTFTNPNSLITIVNNLVPGNNVIFWNITNGTCDANPAFITVVNNEVITIAEIEVFSTPESCVTNGFSGIFANITNPLVPGETGTWTGPPGVTFSPNSEAPTINGLLPGDNVLTWTITRGSCAPSVTTFTLTNNEPNNVNINLNDSDNAACFGAPLNLSADAPFANQTGMWSGPAGSVFSPSPSSPSVTVTDVPVGVHNFYWTLTQDACSLSDSIQVEIYPQPVGTFGVNPTTTVGSSDGSIDICVASGASPFTITWDPPQGTVVPVTDPTCNGESFNIGGLTVGIYTVTITDTNGCEFTSNDIPATDPVCVISLDASDIGITDVSCNGENDGSITIGGMTDTPPLEYSIDGGMNYSSMNVFDNLPPGTYQVFIRDGQLCTAGPVAMTITEPDALTTTATLVHVSVAGGSDGQILLCIEGGTPPYTTAWSPSSVGNVEPSTDPNCIGESLSISELLADIYTVTITDANDCDYSFEAAIYERLDLVLPGNFDNGVIADGKDLLYWGAAYGYTGPVRPDATTEWTPQYNTEDWATSVDGVNSKHQDANGDGTVDTLDLEALELNYGETYGIDSFEYHPTDAMFVIKELDATNTEISFELHIDTPISTHGINARIDISEINGIYDVQIDTTGSSLHPDAFIYRYNEDVIDIALTRTDRVDQIIDGPVVSLVVMVKDVQSLIIPINGGYTMSAVGVLTSIGGSITYDSLSTLVSLGLNHAYCDEKGTAKVYMGDAGTYGCVWSTGQKNTSIENLNIDDYSVAVNDGMNSTMIPFRIDWAFTPVEVKVVKNTIYVDFKESPLSEDVEISLDGGQSYMPPIRDDVSYSLSGGNYQIWIQRTSDKCPTYMYDFTIDVEHPDIYTLPAYCSSSGQTPILYYKLEQYGTIDIGLYNIHGQRLRTLQTGKVGSGQHQIDIDRGNIPRGIYFIYIYYESGGYIGTKTLKILM